MMSKNGGKMKINRVVQNSKRLTNQQIENMNSFIVLNYQVVDKIMTGFNDRFNPNRCLKLTWKRPKPIVKKEINLYQ